MSALDGPLSGPLRQVRVLALGGSSLLLAVGAHLAAGGRSPSAGVLLLSAVLVGLVAAYLTARRCRFPVLLAVLTAEQLALHLSFDALTSAATGCVAMPAHSVVCETGPMSAMAGTGAGMVAAHAVAVLVTAGLLARGEAWLWSLTARVVRAAAAALTPLPTVACVAVRVAHRVDGSRRPTGMGAPRGPPAGR